jgi:hypothetical protein
MILCFSREDAGQSSLIVVIWQFASPFFNYFDINSIGGVDMAASYEIFKEKRLIVVTVSGPADVRELSGMLSGLQSDPDFTMEYDVLWDAQGRTTPFTSDQVRELVRHVLTFRNDGPTRPKRAYLVSRDVDYGMLRVYESYRIGRSDVDIEVFKDRNEALRWLGQKG